MKTFVVVTVEVWGLHYWPDAPASLEYLRCKHKHKFIIQAKVMTEHGNRAVEFFTFADELRAWVESNYKTNGNSDVDFGTLSCEQIAEQLAIEFDLAACAVSEDGVHVGGVQNALVL